MNDILNMKIYIYARLVEMVVDLNWRVFERFSREKW